MNYTRWLNCRYLFLFAFIFINVSTAFAGPTRTTYQAKIMKPDGLPLEAASVNFRFTILDPVGTCILYSENYSSIDMSSTGGLISFALGSGVKTFPVSATTFENVFSNITPALSCDAGGPPIYNPSADDTRKIVMQFHDGNGWQTLPAMSINAVPYAMYANDAQKLGGVSATSFVQTSMIPSCGVSEAVRYNGATFSCVAVGGSGDSVTSGSVITALGYTPANGASITTLTSNLNSTNAEISSVSSTVFAVSSTVSSLSNSVSTLAAATAASFSTITSSQWNTSGTTINYMNGNVGIGTSAPASPLTIIGSSGTPSILAGREESDDNNRTTLQLRRMRADSTQPGADFGTNIGFQLEGSVDGTNASTGMIVNAWETAQINSTTARDSYLSFETMLNNARLEKVRISSAGYVGIGTTNPGRLLTNTDSSASYGNVGDSLSVGQSSNSLSWSVSSAGYVASFVNAASGPTANGIQIRTAGAGDQSIMTLGTGIVSGLNSNDVMVVKASGNVGIDVPTPTTRLDIAGENSASRTLRVKNFDSINGSSYFSVGQNSGSPYLDMQRWIGAGADHNATRISMDPGGGLSFMSSMSPNGGSGPTALELQTYGANMVITGAGNVGIGRSSPSAKLELAAGTVSTAPLKFNSGTLLTSPQSGTIEYDGLQLYYTDGTNTRHALASNSGSQSNSANNTYSGTNTFGGQMYVSNNTTSTNSTTGALVVSGGVGIGGALNVAGQINSGADITAVGLIRGGELHAGAGTANSYKLSAIAPSGVATDLVLFGIDGVSNGFTMQTTASNTLTYSMLTGSSAQGFYQDADGNVGIGTSNPGTILELRKSSTSGSSAGYPSFRVGNANTVQGDGTTTYNIADVAVFAGDGLVDTRLFSRYDSLVGGFVGTNSAHPFHIMAGSFVTPRMTMQPNGNVGIGTTAPTARLEVTSPADTSTALYIGNSTSAGTTGLYFSRWGSASAPMGIQGTIAGTGANHLVLQAQAGNVGIGTTVPASKLDVRGSIIAANTDFSNGAAGSFLQIQQGASTGDTYSSIGAYQSGGNSVSNLILQNAGGNVGIGTTAPNAISKLEVNGRIRTGDTTDKMEMMALTSGGLLAGHVGTVNNIPLAFHTNSSLPQMILSTSGNVGIGTTNPGSILQVAQAQAGRTQIGISNLNTTVSGSRSSALSFNGYNNGGTSLINRFEMGTDYELSSNNSFYIFDNIASISRFYVSSTGNVGIGTTAPQAKLDVAGDIKATSYTIKQLTIPVDGNWYKVAEGSGQWCRIEYRADNGSGNSPAFSSGEIYVINDQYGLAMRHKSAQYTVMASNTNVQFARSGNGSEPGSIWVKAHGLSSTTFTVLDSKSCNLFLDGTNAASPPAGAGLVIYDQVQQNSDTFLSGGFNPAANVVGAISLEGTYGGGLIFKDTAYAGIWTADSGQTLNFSSNGTSGGFGNGAYGQMVLKNGNLGIGTTAPVAKLDVAGQIRPQMGTPTTDSAGTSVDFGTGNTQMATFTSCPGNVLTVNLYSVLEGGSYSLILTTPSGCVVSFTGTNAAYGAGGGVAVTSFKFPGGVNYSSTAEPSVYSFLRGNNIVFGSQVVDFR